MSTGEKTLTPRIRVKALRDGYIYDKMRYGATGGKAASEFELIPFTITDPRTGMVKQVTAEDQFSHEWMERIDGGPELPVKRKMPEDLPPPPVLPSNPETSRTALTRGEVQDTAKSDGPTGSQEVI